MGGPRRDPRAAQRAALGRAAPGGLRLKGAGGLLAAAVLASAALLTFPPGASRAALAATALLALAALAGGWTRPDEAMVLLIGAVPLLGAGPMLLVVALAAAGAAAARRLVEGVPSPLPRALRTWALAFLAVALASAVSSAIRGETLFFLARGGASPLFVNALGMTALDRTRDAARAFLVLTLLLLAFDAFARVAATPRGVRRLLTALSVGSFAAFAATLLERRLPLALTAPAWTDVERRSGTFSDPNALGIATALIAPLLVAAVLDSTRWGVRRAAALGALLLAPLVLELSGSRSALLLLVIAGGLGGIGAWRARRGGRTALPAGSGGAASAEPPSGAQALAALLAALAISAAFVLPRGGSTARGGLLERLGAAVSSSSLDEVSSHRPIFWRTAFEMMEDEPLSGCGLAGFPYEFPDRFARRHSRIRITDNAANALLDVGAECGIPGLLLALAAVVPLLVRASDAALGAGAQDFVSRLDAPARAGGAACVGLAVACLTGSHFRVTEVALLAAFAAALVPQDADAAVPSLVSGRVPVVVAGSGILASLLVLAPTRSPEAAFRTGPWVGVYGWEADESPAQRWMGPRAFRRIEPGEPLVSLALTNRRPDERPVLVTADLDGRRALRLTVPPRETRELRLDGIERGAQALRLSFQPTFVAHRLSGSRDSRELSLVLSRDAGEAR